MARMDLRSYVDTLRSELAVAAATGGEQTRELAERLTAPLESAARLVLLEALSAAADEITRELAPGSVELRLRGREPSFAVTQPLRDAAPAEAAAPDLPPVETDDGATSRINLRLPDKLKARVEEAAAKEGLSVNAWLVRAAAAAVAPAARGTDRTRGRSSDGSSSYTGWVR